MNDAVVEVRRQHWNEHRDAGDAEQAGNLKEHARLLLKRPLEEARASLDQWLVWASRSRLKPMVRVARSIKRVRAFIDATLEHGLSNGRVESVNAKIRLIQQRAFGFHHPGALIALAMIGCARCRLYIRSASLVRLAV